MQEIQNLVNTKVLSMINERAIQNAINEGVENAITKAIKSQFESYGNITQQIDKALKEGLKINLNDLPFETYNEQMLVAVKARIGNMFQGASAEKFMTEMDKVLAPAPKEMTIKDFVEAIAKSWKTDEPWDADELDQYATVEIKLNDYGGQKLSMWKKKEST